MSCKNSIKISDKGLEFLKKLRTNRRKVEVDEEDIAYWKLIDLIGRYFKLNNDRYVEMVNMEEIR